MLQQVRASIQTGMGQLPYRGATYVTVIIGYLLGVFSAPRLTLANFSLFTITQLLYCMLIWFFVNLLSNPKRRLFLFLLLLTLLTLASGLQAFDGVYFDWLLYFVTVGTYFLALPLLPAIIATFLLYLLAGVNIALLDHWHIFSDTTWITMLGGFAFVGAFSLSNKELGRQQRRAEELLHELETSNQELTEAHTQLQQYANEVEELTIVRERTRLAREIHDTLGHYLTILNIQLETISKLQERDPARAKAEVVEARRVAAQSMQEVRNAVAALRPTSVAILNLKDALAQLGNEFEITAHETVLILDLDTELPTLSPDIQHALYRAAQESLTNIHKHAHASKVLLRLRHEDDMLELMILDNGTGTAQQEPFPVTSGFGLSGLRERIELLGGHVTHGKEEPAGYRVTVQVPLTRQQHVEKKGIAV